jgi:hypothetical protein
MQGGREDTTEGMMRIGRIRAVEVAIFGAGLGGMGEALIVGGLLMTAIPTTTSIILGAVPPIAAVVFPKILGGHGSWLSNQVAVVELQHKGTYPLKPPSIGKNVSFASPIATVLGATITGDLRGPSVFISNSPSTVSCAFHDPMLDEAFLYSGVVGGHNSSVMCEERQNSVARVGSAASPPTMMEVDGSNLSANTAALEPSLLLSEVQPSPCLVDFISSITRPVSPPLIAQTPLTNPDRTGLNRFPHESNHSAPHLIIPTDSLNHIPSDIAVEPALPQPHVHETNGYSPLHILGAASEPTSTPKISCQKQFHFLDLPPPHKCQLKQLPTL